MIKLVILFVLIFMLAGCGKVDRMVAGWTGDATSTCKHGVEYLQFTSGATIAYNPDGSVRTCQ